MSAEPDLSKTTQRKTSTDASQKPQPSYEMNYSDEQHCRQSFKLRNHHNILVVNKVVQVAVCNRFFTGSSIAERDRFCMLAESTVHKAEFAVELLFELFVFGGRRLAIIDQRVAAGLVSKITPTYQPNHGYCNTVSA